MTKLKPLISASILSADFAYLADDVTSVLTAGADLVHIDVMDNHYVPNLTFGPLVCQALRNAGIQAPLDVHLMIKPVDAIIPAFAKAGASILTFHPEATEHCHRTIQLIKDHGCAAGLVLNPATPLTYLEDIITEIDWILIMSVNPGFGGQQFLPFVINKIKKVRAMIHQSGKNIRLSVDGGINENNIATIAEAGADTFVIGSAIFNTKNYAEAITRLKEKINHQA